MKIAAILVILLVTSLPGKGQSRIDSLKEEWFKARQQGRTDRDGQFRLLIGNEFEATAQYDSALRNFDYALKNFKNDSLNRAAVLNSIGVIYNNKGMSDSCIFYYQKALTLFRALKDTADAVIAGINLSIIYKNKGWYDQSLELGFDVLEWQERRPADRTLASIYNTIGLVYSLIGDNSNALVYSRKALSVRKAIGYTLGIGQSYNNIGEIYMNTRQYDSALANLFLADQFKKQVNNPSTRGSTLNLIGEVYLRTNQLEKAERYLNEALKIKQKAGERLQEAIILNNLGQLKTKRSDFKSAVENFDRAEKLIRESASLHELRRNFEFRVQLYERRGDTRSALNYQKKLMIINDSILNVEKAEAMIALQMRYETEKKEQRIALLEKNELIQQGELKSKQIWIEALIIIVLVVLCMGAIVIYQYRLVRSGKNKVELLLKELNHRIKNNLQLLSSLFGLQSRNLSDPEALQMIKSSEGRVNAMATIHKKLYGGDVLAAISLSEYIAELVGYLSYTYHFKEGKGIVDVNCPGDIKLDVDKAIRVGLIINELVSNSMKYAWREDQSNAELKIVVHKEMSGIEILVSDNGKGLDINQKNHSPSSFGLMMVDAFVKELKGTLKKEMQNGTTFLIQIPNT